MPSEKQWSKLIPHTSTESRGDIRRADEYRGDSTQGYNGCHTLYEAFRRGHSLNPHGPCLGYRSVDEKGVPTPFIYSTYTEVLTRVNAFAAGLDALNLALPTDDNMTLIGVYMKNCREWFIAEHAIFALGGATVPLYDTLGPESAEFILGQTGTKTVVCTRTELKNLFRVKMGGNCPAFHTVIMVNDVNAEERAMAGKVGLQLFTVAEVEAAGARLIATKGHKHRPPSANDIYTFCYTSGTTGNPKGALLTHTSLLAAVYGAGHTMIATANDRHLSYLPLAHIFERVMVCLAYWGGASIGFYRGDPQLLVEDLQACRPTIFPAAPRVLNRLYDRIHAGIATQDKSKQKVFETAVAVKSKNLLENGTLKHDLYDRLIFNKIKEGLGFNDIRVVVSGSAPLSKKVMTFYRIMLGIPVVEGYGQTEGGGVTSLSMQEDMMTLGHVGVPSRVAEIMLVDVPEMGYLHTDTDHKGQPCQGRGEIWTRGSHVFSGYYKQPEKTAEMLEDGWLKTGDIGLWTAQGQLQIIDRKKNIFKLSQGEYVAPEKIENIITQSLLVAQAFVYGDSLQSSLVAVLIPDEDPIRNLLKTSSDTQLAQAPFSELCKNKKLLSLIKTDIQGAAESGGLHGFEIPKAYYLDTELFSVGNGILTPSMKLKRQQAKEKYQKVIEDMYAAMNNPKSNL